MPTSYNNEILRQLNLSLHRVEVLPYDALGERTGGWLDNVEELLEAQTEDDQEKAASEDFR